jgi:hypothetical protein
MAILGRAADSLRTLWLLVRAFYPCSRRFVSCGSPFGGISIIEHGTSCTQARKVMQKVYVKSQEVAPVNGVLYARGWACALNTSERRVITCSAAAE